MITFMVSVCTLIVSMTVLVIVSTLRWKMEPPPVAEIKSISADINVFVKLIKESEEMK